MTKRFAFLAITATAMVIAVNSSSFAASAPEGLPLWAWGVTTAPTTPGPGEVLPPGAPGSATAPAGNPDNVKKLTIPGAAGSFTVKEISDRFGPADWFPGDHPVMPEIVAKGRASANPPIWACALCHMPNGKGRPENANITGLPYDYFVRQMLDFKEGRRKTSDNRKTNTALMIVFAQQMTREEIEEAARYFTSIPSTPWVKVIESDTAPKTNARGGVYHTIVGEGAGTEPLGNRIVETPNSSVDFEMRHPRSGFTAYVPKGSLKKGEALVTTGGGKTTACTVCHGVDLRGLGPIPTLAGRSPSYTGRALYDMKVGNRTGEWSPLMAPVLANLTNDDILNISAYLASLEP
jgi:cytochrome c553